MNNVGVNTWLSDAVSLVVSIVTVGVEGNVVDAGGWVATLDLEGNVVGGRDGVWVATLGVEGNVVDGGGWLATLDLDGNVMGGGDSVWVATLDLEGNVVGGDNRVLIVTVDADEGKVTCGITMGDEFVPPDLDCKSKPSSLVGFTRLDGGCRHDARGIGLTTICPFSSLVMSP